MSRIIGRFTRVSSRARKSQSALRPNAPGQSRITRIPNPVFLTVRLWRSIGVTGDSNAKGIPRPDGRLPSFSIQHDCRKDHDRAPPSPPPATRPFPHFWTTWPQGQSIHTGTLTMLPISVLAAQPAPFETWSFSQINVVNESSSIDTTDSLQVLHTFTLAFGSVQIATNQTAPDGSSVARSVNIDLVKQNSALNGSFSAPTATKGNSFDLSLSSTDTAGNPGIIHAASLNVGFSRAILP